MFIPWSTVISINLVYLARCVVCLGGIDPFAIFDSVGYNNTGLFPYLASIYQNNEFTNITCRGSIITDRFILTAAHCTFGLNSGHAYVVVGGDQHINIKSVIPHEHFNEDTHSNDIALLRTDKIVFTDKIQPIPLTEQNPVEGLFIINCDEKASNGKRPPKETLIPFGQAIIPVDDKCVLQKVKLQMDYQDSNTIAIFAKDTCQMDSGGPLLWEDPATHRQVLHGIKTRGQGCGSPKDPAIYTRVGPYLNWINESITPGRHHEIKY